MNCLIICAGESSRWGNYLGVPKHLIELEGEKLLARSVRLIRQQEPRAKVYTILRQTDERYELSQCYHYIADLHPENADADKFLSSRLLWNRKGRTVVFYGDVWFSDEAINTILSYNKREWTLFGNAGSNRWTLRSGECFAQSFYPEHITQHEDALHAVVQAYRDGAITVCGGWQHYRAMVGLPLNEHVIKDHFVEIEDFTSDFDCPQDYELWLRRRAMFHDGVPRSSVT